MQATWPKERWAFTTESPEGLFPTEREEFSIVPHQDLYPYLSAAASRVCHRFIGPKDPKTGMRAWLGSVEYKSRSLAEIVVGGKTVARVRAEFVPETPSRPRNHPPLPTPALPTLPPVETPVGTTPPEPVPPPSAPPRPSVHAGMYFNSNNAHYRVYKSNGKLYADQPAWTGSTHAEVVIDPTSQPRRTRWYEHWSSGQVRVTTVKVLAKILRPKTEMDGWLITERTEEIKNEEGRWVRREIP